MNVTVCDSSFDKGFLFDLSNLESQNNEVTRTTDVSIYFKLGTSNHLKQKIAYSLFGEAEEIRIKRMGSWWNL